MCQGHTLTRYLSQPPLHPPKGENMITTPTNGGTYRQTHKPRPERKGHQENNTRKGGTVARKNTRKGGRRPRTRTGKRGGSSKNITKEKPHDPVMQSGFSHATCGSTVHPACGDARAWCQSTRAVALRLTSIC
eukprot:1555867-Amphidinium_carterae.2